MATTQEAVQITAIVPTLTVDDLQKSIAFYEALGFSILLTILSDTSASS